MKLQPNPNGNQRNKNRKRITARPYAFTGMNKLGGNLWRKLSTSTVRNKPSTISNLSRRRTRDADTKLTLSIPSWSTVRAALASSQCVARADGGCDGDGSQTCWLGFMGHLFSVSPPRPVPPPQLKSAVPLSTTPHGHRVCLLARRGDAGQPVPRTPLS